MFSKLLVPIDGSDNSFRALEHGIFLSKKIRAQTTALHIMENFPSVYVQSQRVLKAVISKHQEEVKEILDKAKNIGNKNGVNVETVVMKGDATSNIIDFSKKENYDTIIMGRREKVSLNNLNLGALRIKYLTHSNSTVVIVK